jgi:hypothetical protein
MILHTSTQKLYTDDGRFIKKMHCPRSRELFKLISFDASGSINCSGCGKVIHDTTKMDEELVIRLMAVEPGACLMVDQSNCTLVP